MLLTRHRLTLNRNSLLKNIPGRKGGFSLLEVMLAILLLGTGLAFLLQVISMGLFAGGENEDEIIAINLAQEKTEELRNALYSGISQDSPPVTVSGFTAFTREILVTTPQTGLKQVSVNIYWNAGHGQTSLAMVTYVSDV